MRTSYCDFDKKSVAYTAGLSFIVLGTIAGGLYGGFAYSDLSPKTKALAILFFGTLGCLLATSVAKVGMEIAGCCGLFSEQEHVDADLELGEITPLNPHS